MSTPDPRKPTMKHRPLAARLPDGRIEVLVGAGVYRLTEEEARRLVEKVQVALDAPIPQVRGHD